MKYDEKLNEILTKAYKKKRLYGIGLYVVYSLIKKDIIKECPRGLEKRIKCEYTDGIISKIMQRIEKDIDVYVPRDYQEDFYYGFVWAVLHIRWKNMDKKNKEIIQKIINKMPRKLKEYVDNIIEEEIKNYQN